nr:hypothetical protein [Tanacetum cinerariifolium]
KAFRVFNSRTHIVQETLHVNFMENKPNVAGSGPAWLCDIDSLTQTMNYHPVIAENQTNSHAGFQDTKKAGEEGTQTYVLFSVLSDGSTNSQNNNKGTLVDGKEHDDDIQKFVSHDVHSSNVGAQTRRQGDKTENKDKGKSPVITITGFRDLNAEFKECNNNSSNVVNAASSSVSAAGQNSINSTNDFSAAGPSNAAMPNLEDLSHDADDVGAEADINNLKSIISVSHIPTTRIHKDHSTSQIISDLSSTTQTRSMARAVRDQGGISQMFNEDFHTCMFACFLSQEEPKRVHQALKDPSWIKAMQEELLQFKMQKVWILVDLPYGKRAIGTKWVYRNKKDKRGIFIRNKARLVAQGHTQEEGIDYEEETLHDHFMENKPNVAGSGPAWLFDIDSLSQTMDYHPVLAENQTNSNAGFRDLNEEFEECVNNNSNEVNAAGSLISAAELNFANSTNDFCAAGPSNPAMPNLEDLSHNAHDVGAEADINNMESIISVSPIPTSRIYKDHLTSQIIGDLSSTTQTRSMSRGVRDQGGISQMFNEDFHTCMFACFLSQEEPKRVHQALKDPSWIEAMQEELLQFKMQKVWILVDLPYGKRAIGTK